MTLWIQLSDVDIDAIRTVPALAYLARRIDEITAEREQHSDLIEAAYNMANDDLNIDEDAPISVTDNGAWVGAWVFVYSDEYKDEEDEDA